MDSKKNKRQCGSGLVASNIAYWMIRLMHDNPILPLVKNPYKILDTAGLKKGQKVVEVGCGPGFFTIPAAKIVGEGGHIYAIDINPRMAARVKEKIEKQAIENVTVMCTNASNTDLVDESIDLVFLFGLPYVVGGLEEVIHGLHRVLKPGGNLSFKKAKVSETKLIYEIERGGFTYTGKQGRIFLFTKKGG
jgi:ubiquinone/menaquinone biosynthesis C-methylase UbiE